ncbi:MAG: TerC family protein, partial [Gammaproteobacteria bacterium]|nr:TerC family protein [Gammaproteobacteria bacterium]
MEMLLDPQVWLAFATLTVLEIVLGIDNIIFLAILVGRLPPEQRARARIIGLGMAMLARIMLLLSLAWLMQLSKPWFVLLGNEISGRDLVLILGGLFLLFKSTMEIHNALEGAVHGQNGKVAVSFSGIILQIALI